MFVKQKLNFLPKIGLILGAVVLLTALGCKQQTSTTETNEAAGATPEISFPTNETATNEADLAELLGNVSTSPTISPTASPAATGTSSPTPTASPTATVSPEPSPTPVTDDEDEALMQKAEKLAEIYGTYTNKDQEAYKNLKDLKQYATTKFQAWIDLQTKKTIDPKAAFYGVTTKALSSAIIESSGNAKKILVTVKKEEITTVSATPKTGYKLLLLNFTKEKNEWMLNEIYWQ